MFNDEQVNSPKLIRKRSSSLDSKAVSKYRENNYYLSKHQEKQMKKYASSSSLINFDVNANRPKKTNANIDGYYLFVNWYRDFRTVKPYLLGLHDPNIFKTDFRQNEFSMKHNSIFLIMHNLKIDNEYEALLINDYNERLNELIKWGLGHKEDEEYFRQLELMSKQINFGSSESFSENDNEQDTDDVKSKTRRYVETMALIIQNKNQPMNVFVPREIQGQMNTFQYACEFEIYYLSQDKKGEKNFKSVSRIGILSNQDINIFTKNLKLKDSYTLKHIYLGQCSESQIPNIDSCLRIGGPFGNDMIIRFQSPLTRNDWYKYLNEKITAYQETIKSSTTAITIFNDTNPASSAPLVSKSLPISGTTNGSNLKKMAMNIFEIKDIDFKDLLIVFLLKNKENILHDDVSPMVLQEHANNIQDNNCVKSCMHCDRGTVAVKIIYYLRSNRPVNTISDNIVKGVVQNKKPYQTKLKQNKYNINGRWIENEMPKWLMILLADLYNEGAKCEGIFRLTGSVTQSDDYVNQIAETDDVKIDTNIHNKTNILKKFISIIDGSLLTTITKENFTILTSEIVSTDDFLTQDELQTKLIGFIQKIPPNHLNFFQHILVILDTIIKNSQINQMNITNVSTCFSQNLFKHLSDDPNKINRLFECILLVRERIVNPVTYNNIIRSFESRKLSSESAESHPKSDVTVNVDSQFNSLVNSETISNSNDEKKSISDKPIVPPRRKKNIRNRTTLITPDESPVISSRSISRQMSLKDKRQSSSVILTMDVKDKYLDELDSRFTSQNLDDPILPSKSPARLTQKSKKLSRSSNTFSTNQTEIMNTESSNFTRQNQVNRKHNKTNSNVENINQIQNNAKNNVNQLKSSSKLTRSTDRVISKTRSRSQSKLAENVPNINSQPTKVTYHYNADAIQNFDQSKKMQTERKRSSSACRVPKLKEQYESIQQNPRPPIPTKKHSFIVENQKVQKLVKDLETNKTIEKPKNLTRNLGPIRPSHNLQSKNTLEEHSKPSTLSHASNRLSLHDKLNDSNDDDVTYI